jgi:AmiR/NasT family two-component response regulator
LSVAVFHPADEDGEELLLQLRRIGCHAQAFWPPVPHLPEGADVVFIAVRPDTAVPNWLDDRDAAAPTIIAIVNYENPTIVDMVVRLEVHGIVPSPIRAFGLMSALVVARQIRNSRTALTRQVQRLESKLAGVRHVAEAKAILMRARNVSEPDAYQIIRDQAMAKRTTVEHIAYAIVSANDILFR